MRRLRESLLYTAGGELDLGWLLLLIAFANAIVFFDLAAFRLVTISVAAWAFYGSMISLCFIAGAAISRARLIAGSSLPGQVAQGIAQSVEPNLFTDDERGRVGE